MLFPDFQLELLARLDAQNIVLQKIEQSPFRFNRSALWQPGMATALRNPSFPAFAERIGLMHYWKATHTKPDVCSDKNPPAFCGMI